MNIKIPSLGLALTIILSPTTKTVSAADIAEINMIYANIPNTLTAQQRDDLSKLRESGISIIGIKGYSINEIQNKMTKFRSDPTLSKFNYIIDVSGIIHDAWESSSPNVCTKGAEYVPTSIKDILKSAANLGLNNNFISGYYTFDEPSTTTSIHGTKGICKEFQEAVYHHIRSLDTNKDKRPVLLSNTLWSLSDQEIQRTMSINSQDATFLEIYDGDIRILMETLSALKRNKLQEGKYIYTLPAYGKEKCVNPLLSEQFQPTLEAATKNIFYNTALPSLGISYFAYWPDNKPDFLYAIDNCTDIKTSTLNHIKNLPDLVATKISNTPKDMPIGQLVEFSVEIKNIGSRALPNQWIGVLLLIDDKCPDSGCLWGGITTSLQPGESKTIPINGNGRWRTEIGVHSITAIVDDQKYAIEAKKSNNQLTRTINFQNKPDLIPTSLSWNPIVPSQGDSTHFLVETENIGNVSTAYEWIGVLYTVDGICPAVNGCQWGGTNISLAPGERVSIGTIQNPWTANAGTHQIGALIDDQNRIPESNENNNTIFKIIDIK